MAEAIKETTGRSAFQTMSNHFKWDSTKCRLCHTVASLHLLPPELIEAMHGSKEAEIGAVQMMKDQMRKPGSSIMGPPKMSKMDSVGDVIGHLQTGSIIFNNNRRGENDATMTGFFIITDASQHIQDGTLDLLKFKTNPYKTRERAIIGTGHGQFQHYRAEVRCTLNQLAYGCKSPQCDL